jgi:hypothetical protein
MWKVVYQGNQKAYPKSQIVEETLKDVLLAWNPKGIEDMQLKQGGI